MKGTTAFDGACEKLTADAGSLSRPHLNIFARKKIRALHSFQDFDSFQMRKVWFENVFANPPLFAIARCDRNIIWSTTFIFEHDKNRL